MPATLVERLAGVPLADLVIARLLQGEAPLVAPV